MITYTVSYPWWYIPLYMGFIVACAVIAAYLSNRRPRR